MKMTQQLSEKAKQLKKPWTSRAETREIHNLKLPPGVQSVHYMNVRRWYWHFCLFAHVAGEAICVLLNFLFCPIGCLLNKM